MKPASTFYILLCCVIVLGIAARVWAQPAEPADVGTKICRDVQLLAQTAAGDEEEASNHGQWVSAASRVVKPLVESGVITAECDGYILRQFALSIPAEAQEQSGPDRICGDGEIDPGEECDDGNNEDGDGCSAVCENEKPPCFSATFPWLDVFNFADFCYAWAGCGWDIFCDPFMSEQCEDCVLNGNSCTECDVLLVDVGLCMNICEFSDG